MGGGRVARWMTLAGLVALSISGCTTGAPASPSTPTPSAASMPEAQVIASSGALEVELDIPSGAASLSVKLACADGRFTVGTNQMGQERSGSCGGMAVLDLELAKVSPMLVWIGVEPDVSFVAQLEFSAEPMPVNTPLAHNCDAIARFLNAGTNADAGYKLAELDLDQWRERVDEGAESLRDLTPTPPIEPVVEPLIEWAASAQAPGVFTTSIPSAAAAALSIAKQICADGNRALVLIGEYGG